MRTLSQRKCQFKVVYSYADELVFDFPSSPCFQAETAHMNAAQQQRFIREMRDVYLNAAPVEEVFFNNEETAIRYLETYLSCISSYDGECSHLEVVRLSTMNPWPSWVSADVKMPFEIVLSYPNIKIVSL